MTNQQDAHEKRGSKTNPHDLVIVGAGPAAHGGGALLPAAAVGGGRLAHGRRGPRDHHGHGHVRGLE